MSENEIPLVFPLALQAALMKHFASVGCGHIA